MDEHKLETGYVQVYTGNGKGKTSAAFGLAMRAAGAGLRVFVGQFMKGQHYSELDSALELSPKIIIEQFGHPEFCVPGKVCEQDYRLAADGLRRIREVLAGDEYDVVILDEICTALHFKLVPTEEVVEIVNSKPKHVELILTGRYAPEAILDVADLVTEMMEVKHYFTKNVMARKGIEN